MGAFQKVPKCSSKGISFDACSVFALVWIATGLLVVWATNGSFHPLFQGLELERKTNLDPQSSMEMLGFFRVNDTAKLLMQVTQNGTKQCHNMNTTHANFFGLPCPIHGSQITLSTDQVHEFYILSYENGSRKCNGGDFYETDLSGANWKSRPPIEDLEDGSYAVKLFVDNRFEGLYTFTAVLLFSNFHGLERDPEKWFQQRTVITLQIEFKSAIRRAENESSLHLCSDGDFRKKEWAGRWNRIKGNDTCNFDSRGRSICIAHEEQCKDLWCMGAVGALESNGWVYSAHCKFRIWTKDEAWKCLNHKWLFFWGDSNHQDTIRNLLNFILDSNYVEAPRDLERNVTDPNDSSRSFRITSLFNGHHDVNFNFLGLDTIKHPMHQESLKKIFTPEEAPDVAILNSGLHDGMHWLGFVPFLQPAEYASDFWHDLWMNTTKRPLMVYRSTVAPAGKSRQMPSNPQKMEAYNRVLREQLLKRFPDLRMVDAYDMTFPWHYDHCCSDGGHYGRPPSPDEWDGKRGHMYFVDVMLGHVLLNAICPLP